MSRLPSGWIPERTLEEDIMNMQTDVLSARCAADRLRLKREMEQVAKAASMETVEKLRSDLGVVLAFVAELERAKIRRKHQ